MGTGITGEGEERGMGSRMREDKRGVRGLRVKVRKEGWVPAYARIRNVCGEAT